MVPPDPCEGARRRRQPASPLLVPFGELVGQYPTGPRRYRFSNESHEKAVQYFSGLLGAYGIKMLGEEVLCFDSDQKEDIQELSNTLNAALADKPDVYGDTVAIGAFFDNRDYAWIVFGGSSPRETITTLSSLVMGHINEHMELTGFPWRIPQEPSQDML